MPRRAPLPIDPIAEARRQWVQHGWNDAAEGMAAVTSIMRAQQLMQARVDAVLKPFSLSFARYELLRLLAFTREGRMPMVSVISRLQVHPASVTSVVNRLSASGLVNREPHPSDGRANMLVLTPRGRELVERATVELNEKVFTKLEFTPEDLTSLTAGLARMRKAAGDYDEPRDYPAPLDR